jgi:hypothetical protein
VQELVRAWGWAQGLQQLTDSDPGLACWYAKHGPGWGVKIASHLHMFTSSKFVLQVVPPQAGSVVPRLAIFQKGGALYIAAYQADGVQS